jgi:hypothetical protein
MNAAEGAAMDLICYLHPGWAPLVRPAPATRGWMDRAPDSFAYRCLPLNIANAHGWEILNPCAFTASWNGTGGTDAVTVVPDPGARAEQLPVSLFGQGVLTFHIEGIFRTPPGWNLWVGGSPNRAKDGIAPLGGVIETDWSPYTFTMNWRFTRPHTPMRFEAMEPFCFIFPVERGAIQSFKPRFESLDQDPATEERFLAWSQARDNFHATLSSDAPPSSADHWQKHYYRGTDVTGATLVDDHVTKLRLAPFDRRHAPAIPEAPANNVVADDTPSPGAARPLAGSEAEELARLRLTLAKREWMLDLLERQRALSPATLGIERRADLTAEEFLERYYSTNRPVILTGKLQGWPALDAWTPDYLKAKLGDREVEIQSGRAADPEFEMRKDAHRSRTPFSAFIDQISRPGAGNDAYITAYNSAHNDAALAPLGEDLGELGEFLVRPESGPFGMFWIGPAGTFTSLHHDLTNNFVAQITGRKRLKLLPPSETGKLYNRIHVFSEVPDLDDPALDIDRYGDLTKVRIYDLTLNPGEIVFIPVGWWHQVRSLDFSVSITYTSFIWDNDGYQDYPAG